MQEIVLSNNTIMANHNNLTFQLNWFFYLYLYILYQWFRIKSSYIDNINMYF